MPLAQNRKLKLYYSIKEVAEMFDVSESLLRYWEKEFPTLHPKTSANNVRQYTEADIKQVRNIYNLVKDRGFKIAAARKMISKNPGVVDKSADILTTLNEVKDQLKDLKKQLDSLQ